MPDPEARKPESRETRIVFVVERDVHMRRLLTEFLDPLRCTVEFFDDGYAALDAVRRNPPILLVTDVLVPKLDGLTLCRLVKEDQKLRDVKVVILSAVAARERARLSRADAFLEKPIERDRILQLIQDLTNLRAEEGR
jgi:CheY-like chemotaxis protein